MDISEFIISVLKFTIDGASAAAAKSLQSCPTQRPHGLKPTRLLHPWDFPGRSTRVGCHCLLQGIFQTQGWKLGVLHCRKILYCLSHQGSLYMYYIYFTFFIFQNHKTQSYLKFR